MSIGLRHRIRSGLFLRMSDVELFGKVSIYEHVCVCSFNSGRVDPMLD